MSPSAATSVEDFLAGHLPFSQLGHKARARAAATASSRTVSAGATILDPGQTNDTLYLIRAGAVELRSPEGQLLGRLGEGDFFGHRSLFRGGQVENRVRAIEDTTLLLLPGGTVRQLCEEDAAFAYFICPADRRREAAPGRDDSLQLLSAPVGSLIAREPVTVGPQVSIREAVTAMSRERVSSLLVEQDGVLVGIVTDRDLRNRVVAPGLSVDRPVAEIMTPSPLTVDAGGYVFQALLTMARRGIHHLPVLEEGRVVGMLTSTDLLHRRSNSVVYTIGEIQRQDTLEGLVAASGSLPQMLLGLVEAGGSCHAVGYVVTSVGEAITRRLLELAERRLGPPPVPYVWMAGGSMARNEQTGHSDQDNFLILSDEFRAEAHDPWFRELARFVCDGLNACGYVYCPGEIMATNAKWRQPLQVWRRYFDVWIGQPHPEALLNASVFFDQRAIHGEHALADALRQHFLAKGRANGIFLAHMARNALRFPPPLGFFRNLVLIRGGKHDHTLDLKAGGTVPIVELARVHALAAGVPAVNTVERLRAAGGAGDLSREGAADLVDAYERIGSARLRHQAALIRAGHPPDNFLRPDTLSSLERASLKDAFAVVQRMQSALASAFQVGRLG